MSTILVNFCYKISDNNSMNTFKQFMEICDERLKELGMTRAQLLREINQSPSLFTMALKREQYINIESIVQISKILSMPVSILLGIEESVPSDIRLMMDMLMKIPERDRKMIALNIKNYYDMALSEKK